MGKGYLEKLSFFMVTSSLSSRAVYASRPKPF
ncbi:hypothetical protein CTO_0960 [Chlamydia trachomatis A2497]|uniref:Uncharacterized protein n=1 Tax=Chlamydia trachomatis serovar A (strain A2497) TaxID=580047 RepID=G4NP57_CHLT4|nr:hypothetical protein CTO_0960 [Chlamydia trachomatis A2497]